MRVAAGTTWEEIDAVTSPHGLATPGDIGHLTRRFGLALDNLLEADVVFSDGRVLRAAADEHPGLYWALRGGAEIGHVTSALYRLHRVGPVVGGPTYWPIEHADAVLGAYRYFLPAAPRTLTGAFTLRRVPFPDERRVCGVLWCADSPEAIEPFLAGLPEPLLHGVQPLPHTVLRRTFAAHGERRCTCASCPRRSRDRDAVPGRRRRPRPRLRRHGLAAPRRPLVRRLAVAPAPRPAVDDDGWECARELGERLAAMQRDPPG